MLEWNAGTNIATQRAKDLLKPYSEKRYEEEQNNHSGADWKYCQKCRGRKIMQLYHKDDMEHIVYVKKNGKKYKVHYCKECYKSYKPHSKRPGIINA